MTLLRRARKNPLPPLSEADVYARCHGARGFDVRIVKVEPKRPRYDLEPSGEGLHEALEKRLESRDSAKEEDAPAAKS
ncbi:MAG: hypothetical protein ABSB96_01755 [Gaiellaceae bacterium]